VRVLTLDDRKGIVVGRPLRFSIYTSDRKLLLAAGRIVPNEFVREGLIRSGVQCSDEVGAQTADVAAHRPTGPLGDLQEDYRHTSARTRVGFRMERDGIRMSARVIGVSDEGSGLIMSGPVSLEGTPVQVHEGESWTFRALYATAAVRFCGTVGQVAEEPFRYFYVSKIADVDRRAVRAWPRTLTSLWTARVGEIPRVITDLSVGGARVASKNLTPLQPGQLLLLNPSLPLATGPRDVSLDATVLNVYGRTDPTHPLIDFYGVRFDKPSETDRLLLHAYVQEHLSLELDRVWHVLTVPSTP